MKTKPISTYCTNIPTEPANYLDAEFAKIQEHYLLSEFDDLLVDSGRMCEAMLRYLEWRMTGTYTAIDGRSKPNRNQVFGAGRNSTTIEPSMRQQGINLTETVMDLRNNRNAAHLGDIDPNIIDAMTAYQILSWVVAELIRVEASVDPKALQELVNKFAERPIPVIYSGAGKPTVLDANIGHDDEVLVLLYDNNGPVEISTLFKWTHHGNVTRWRRNVIDNLAKQRFIVVNNRHIYISPTGRRRAETVIAAAAR